MEDSTWVSTREAADLLGVSTARIRQLVAANELSAKKLGGKYRGQWLVSTSDIIKRLSKSAKGEFRPMRVKNRMTRAPITAQPKTTYNEALRLMEQNDITHLPIINKKGDMVGIVTQHDMLEAEPSRVSTLSIFEIASLLDKVTMDQLMSHPVKAVESSCSVSEAAHFMLEENIGCLPVMEEGKLVGIITDSDIFKTFVEVTGGGESGTRIEAKLPNVMGQLASFTRAVTESGGWIVSLALTYDESGEFFYIDMKERGGDEAKLQEELDKMGTVEYVRFDPCSADQLLEIE